MVQKLTSYEQRHPELYQDKFKRVALVETEEDEDSADDQEVAVAEWARGGSTRVLQMGLVDRRGKDKPESSHSRGKDKEEADPRDRPQHDDRRYLTEEEVRSVRYNDHSLHISSRNMNSKQQQAFDDIKEYLTKPPVLVPPQQDRPFYIYLSVADTSIASVVVQVYDGLEKVVFYLSRRMLDAETRYPEIEKLCLCLFFTCTKIQHILLSAEVIVICKSDVIKHMLSAPVLKGRLGKWMFALSEFDIRYHPAKEVKGQALADLIAERINTDVAALSVRAWTMFFDGSVCEDGCGIGMLLVSPQGGNILLLHQAIYTLH
ncbi:hypothetical protein QYE76_004937 [Lolium multiflorum]|uniref:Reverse transcriptase/retrotransposon-derived protein RNase H-like domain-containing protein n=1 Tax=Lolium multiflorum TaxID=4521 RepID=A0AAD8RTF4_LOLMU|nr:hypothetical protein QYE76_004937 [Lolium multiflorum]